MNVLAIIPARGGSKGVKNKNIKPLNGKPLIQYTIECIQPILNENIDLVVSTDCTSIAEVASSFNVEVMMRDPLLATDGAKMPPVVMDVLKRLEEKDRLYDAILLLQPTCPFRTTEHVRIALKKLVCEGFSAVTSFTQVGDTHPARMYRIINHRLSCLEPEFEYTNRQDLPPTYIRNGLIYAVTKQRFLETQSFFHNDAYPLIIDKLESSVNIDEMIDFYLAEAILKNNII